MSKINEDSDPDAEDLIDPMSSIDEEKGHREERKPDEIPWWFQPFYLHLFSMVAVLVLILAVTIGFHVTLQVKSGQCALTTSSNGLEGSKVYSKGTHFLGLSRASHLSVFQVGKDGARLGDRKLKIFGNLSMGICPSCPARFRADRRVHGYIRVFSNCPQVLYEQAASPADNFSYAFTSIVLRELRKVGEVTPPEDFDPGNRNLELQKITELLASNSMGKINGLAEKLGIVVAGTDIKLEQLRT